ncbi:MAG: response regulator transcription factor [Dinghuibacter sp.]|nr:response regulator transcription factor [Dinghuibacter sp.]
MKTRCIIVEDDAVPRLVLERFCERHPQLELAGSFPTAEQALEFLQHNETDIIFLDVMLPGINGFEFLDQLPFLPKVILTTSDTSFAFTAFEYHVTDYLKKPLSYPRFEAAIGKAVGQPVAAEQEDELFIRSEGQYVRLYFPEILYVESMGDYVKYVTAGKEYITHSTLKNTEAQLPPHLFMKIHRCYIVNLKQVGNIADNMAQVGSAKIPVSKAIKAELLQRLNIARK